MHLPGVTAPTLLSTERYIPRLAICTITNPSNRMAKNYIPNITLFTLSGMAACGTILLALHRWWIFLPDAIRAVEFLERKALLMEILFVGVKDSRCVFVPAG